MDKLNQLSILVLGIGIVIVLLFGASKTGKATVFIWMLACLLFGAAIGFLFGIPKILQNNQIALPGTAGTPPTYQQQVNTNLTEISDWLTKIIVGLGLVNLTKIPPYLSGVATILASGLSHPATTPTTMAMAFSYGIIVSFSILGFLFGYLSTRLYLAVAFSEADQKALRSIVQKSEDAAGAAKSALQKVEFALIQPSETQQAEHQLPEAQLDQLAAAYNQVRREMPSGTARTRRMAEIFKSMMALVPFLHQFDVLKALQETDNGKRLAGYAYLSVMPSYKYVEALVDSFTTDPTPFGQYWGIQTLVKMMEQQPMVKLPGPIFKKIKDFYTTLTKGVDREYELRNLFPELKE